MPLPGQVSANDFHVRTRFFPPWNIFSSTSLLLDRNEDLTLELLKNLGPPVDNCQIDSLSQQPEVSQLANALAKVIYLLVV